MVDKAIMQCGITIAMHLHVIVLLISDSISLSCETVLAICLSNSRVRLSRFLTWLEISSMWGRVCVFECWFCCWQVLWLLFFPSCVPFCIFEMFANGEWGGLLYRQHTANTHTVTHTCMGSTNMVVQMHVKCHIECHMHG